MPKTATVRWSRFPWWFWVVMAGLFLVLVVAIALFLRSATFEGIVRDRVVTELEKVTGGTVELQELHWNLSTLEIQGKGLTIHGLEPGSEAPLAHVDHLYLKMRVVSLLKTSIDLQQLRFDQPVIHVIVKPDGSTNLPQPKMKSTGDPVQELFDLAIGRMELRDGTLLLNQEQLSLDFKANDVELQMNFAPGESRYDGTLHAGKIDGRYQDFRDVPATADAEFSVWRNRAQVRSLKLTSQNSTVDLSGRVDDFNHPKLQLAYGGTIDLGQAAAIARVRTIRGGGASFSGSGTFRREDFSTAGKLNLRGVNYEDPSLSFRDFSAGTEFSLDRDRILLKKIDARVLGGLITGQAEVIHYALGTASAQPASRGENSSVAATKAAGNSAKAGAQPIQQGSAALKVSGASLAEFMRILSSKSLPLEKLNAAGSVNGTVNVSWKESITRAVAEMELDSSVPEHPAGDQLPVIGTLRGSYDVRRATTEFSMLSLATPRTEAKATGTLGAHTAELKLGITTTNLQEFQPLLSAMGQSSVPVELRGRASFSGTLSGRLDHPDISGRLLATDFTYVYTPATPAAAAKPVQVRTVQSLLHLGHPAEEAKPLPAEPARRIRIDSFAGDVQYAGNLLAVHNGVIEQGNAHLNVDASATLENGSFTRNSPFQVNASVHNASVADLQQTVGTNYPIAGTANLTLQASGTQADPHGSGHLSVSGGEAYGHAIKTFRSGLVLANHEAQLQNIRVEALGGALTGMAGYNLSARQLRSDLRGDNIDLAQINELQSVRLQEHGIASFTLKTSGAIDQPQIDGHFEISNLVVNDEYAGDLIFEAVSHGDKVQLAARSNFQHASLALDGTIAMKGDMQSDLRLQFTDVDIDPLLMAELKTSITGHSALNGHASFRGPLRQPRMLKGSMLIEAFAVELQKIPIQSDGPIELTLDDEVISIKRLTVMAADTNLSFGGSVDFKGERPVDLYAKGHLNIVLFHALDDEITSYGTADADVTVKGSLADPTMNGRVVIAHAGFSVIDLPAALGEVNGTMVFNKNRLEVEHLSGRVGGGQVNFSGYITYGNIIAFDLKSTGTDIRFRYGGVSLTANQDLHLAGSLKNATLSGEVTITRFAQIPSLGVTTGVVPQPPEMVNPTSPLNNLHFDVHIVSAPELTVQTSLAKLSGDADLRLRGTGTRPVLLGRVNIDEGDININGQKYHLDRGDVTFANPIRIDPILDMEATTRVRDFDITIGLHGTMEKLTTTYRSDPPLSSDDIIALLAFGRTQEESYAATGASNGSIGEGAGNLVLGQAINQMVSNRVSKLFGISSIKINPAVGGADNNPTARLTIEQQVSNNVTLTYITNLTQSAQQVIQFEYNINSEYTVQGIRDENGVVSFDLLIRKRKK
jgi:translocation and assembly module TamB